MRRDNFRKRLSFRIESSAVEHYIMATVVTIVSLLFLIETCNYMPFKTFTKFNVFSLRPNELNEFYFS